MVSSSRGGGRVEHDFIHRVARRLATLRRERGISQENLAAILGIAAKNLQRIESGRQNLSLSTIARVCEALEVVPESAFVSEASEEAKHQPDKPARAPSLLERLDDAGIVVWRATSRGRRPADAIPVTTLRAAAGRAMGTAREIEVLGFATIPRRGRRPEGHQFIAEIRGRSMDPRIPSGSVCLFVPARPPPYEGRIFLVTHPSISDDDLGGPYALKRIGAVTKLRSGKTRLVLESLNNEFAPMAVTVADDERPIVSELERVLVRGDDH